MASTTLDAKPFSTKSSNKLRRSSNIVFKDIMINNIDVNKVSTIDDLQFQFSPDHKEQTIEITQKQVEEWCIKNNFKLCKDWECDCPVWINPILRETRSSIEISCYNCKKSVQ